MKKRICDMDCFHCKFADCINDDLPPEKRVPKKDTYYARHKEERLEYQRKYVAEHREKIREYFKKYYEEHKASESARHREYYRTRYNTDEEFRQKERARAHENWIKEREVKK